MPTKELQSVSCKTLHDLRSWLETNHQQKESVWLIYHKPTSGIGDITYTTLVDELLCFGWIDSLPRKIDEVRTSIRISPRNPKSKWSRINKDKVKRLTKDGRMHTSGLAVVTLAKKSGTWDALNDVENLVVPAILHTALSKHKLLTIWDSTSRSKRRGWLEQLQNAKSPETKHKRIQSIIDNLQT